MSCTRPGNRELFGSRLPSQPESRRALRDQPEILSLARGQNSPEGKSTPNPLKSENSCPGKYKLGVNSSLLPSAGAPNASFLMATRDDCFWKARCAGRSLRTSQVPGSCAELGPAVEAPEPRPAGRERRRGRLARGIQATGGIPCGPRRWIWGSCHSGSQRGPHGPRFLPAALRGS